MCPAGACILPVVLPHNLSTRNHTQPHPPSPQFSVQLPSNLCSLHARTSLIHLCCPYRLPARRQNLRVAAREDLELALWRPVQPTPPIGMLYAEVSSIKDKGRPGDINADVLIEHLIRSFEGQVGGGARLCQATLFLCTFRWPSAACVDFGFQGAAPQGGCSQGGDPVKLVGLHRRLRVVCARQAAQHTPGCTARTSCATCTRPRKNGLLQAWLQLSCPVKQA